MKKALATLCVFLVALGMVFAQGGIEQSATKNGPAPKAGVTDITVMVYERGKEFGNGCSTIDNLDTRWINSQLESQGVRVTYVPVPRSGADNTVNTLLAAGEGPDVIMSYDRERVSTYGSQGGLVDLKPYLDRLDPEYLKKIEGVPLTYCTFDGAVYALPRIYGISKRGHYTYIRKDICDKLGMPVPSTREELIDYLYAVKKNFPDMIPYDFSGKGTDACFFNFVLSYTNRDNERDNYIYEPTFTICLRPGTKEGFRQLNRFVLDGIIPSDFALDSDETKFRQAQANGKAAFILYGSAEDSALALFSPESDYMLWPVDCLANTNGEHIVPSSGAVANYVYVPKTAEKKIDAVMKYLAFMSNYENAFNLYGHDIGTGSTLNELGVPIYIGGSASGMAKLGYSPNITDLTMLYTSFWFGSEAEISSNMAKYPNVPREYFEEMIKVNMDKSKQYDSYKIPTSLKTDQYVPLLQSLICEFAFKVMCAPEGQFDKVWDESYKKLVDNHLEDVLNERAAWYDANMAK